MQSPVYAQLVAQCFVFVATACAQDKSMAVFEEFRVGSTIDKLWLLIPQQAVEINVERVPLQNHAVVDVIDANFPRLEHLGLRLVVDLALEAIDKQLVAVLEPGAGKDVHNAALVLDEKDVLAHQPIHDVPPQHLLAIDPDHALPAYRSMLQLDVKQLPVHWKQPACHDIVLVVVPPQRLTMVRDVDVLAHSFAHD
jgi:hypothetical protein